MRIGSILICSLALMLASSLSRAADQVDNPQYSAWAKYAVNSSQTLEGTMQAGSMKITQTMVRKLTEKADDHLTVEMTVTMQMMGQEHATPPLKITVPAKTDPKSATSLANEKVEAAGKTFDCKVYEVKSDSPKGGGDAKMKIWVSSDVPGGLVKMETTSTRGTVDWLLRSFEAK